MNQGYGVFGKAYEIMFRNDLHASESVDHAFLRNMILLDDESASALYSNKPICYNMENHELYAFSQKFRTSDDRETIRNVLYYTSSIAKAYDLDFKEMLFGGTEREILERSTDWCADMARVGAVILQCLDIPCRIIHLANLEKAYNGHVAGEAFYEGKYGLVDFIYGYQMLSDGPVSARDIQENPEFLAPYPEDYKEMFSGIAINEYDPTDPSNDYTLSKPNKYYMKLIYEEHQDQWIMGEDKQ